MLREWIVNLTKELGLRGATRVSGIEGFGHTGKIHSAHFFGLADQPMEIRLAMTDEKDQRLFERLAIEDVALFISRCPLNWTLSVKPWRIDASAWASPSNYRQG